MVDNLVEYTVFLISSFSLFNFSLIILLFSLYKLSTFLYSSENVLHIINDPFESVDPTTDLINHTITYDTFRRGINPHLKSIISDTVESEADHTYKSLTEIPTRQDLVASFNEIKTEKDLARLSVFIIDIDRFRTINELYGREFGNRIIVQIANRIDKYIENNLLIAREGEDELLLLMKNLTVSEMRQIGDSLVDIFISPFMVNDKAVYITASIGISSYPTTSEKIEDLLQQAEIAMYFVKRSGRNNYHLFMPQDAVEIERKRRIEFGLKEALVNNELFLAFQPKVRIETGEIYAVESLLRWKHPELGLVSPVEFIPIAEESGIIHEIGYWVLHEAARQTVEWQERDIRIQNAVNVSALQFEDPYFISRVKNVLDIYSLEPCSLIIEITESVMKDVDQANKVIRELHDIGISVAIDDFGTGYSSLSVLNNTFIDIVKIDKSFIDHVNTKESTAALVKTIIQMGRSLDFQITAEGIENDEQRLFLKCNGCEFGQGYFYSKPISREEVVDLILSTKHSA